MKTSILIMSLILLSFVQSFGQKATGIHLIAKANEFPDSPLFETNDGTGKLWERIKGFETKESMIFGRVDPYMPIAVPPRDEYTEFPIKIFPEDFPSKMPINGLGEMMPEREEKPKVIQIPK
jgi:hypothetical protein